MESSKIISNIKIKIIEEEVFRYLGYRKGFLQKIPLDIKNKVREEINHVDSLLDSKGIYQFLDVISISTNGNVFIAKDYTFSINREMIHLLENVELIFFALVTIGPRIEEVIKKRFDQNQYIQAVILDAVGTVAVKTLAQWFNYYIEHESSHKGYQFSRYFEPGSGDWNLREQKKIFHILEPEKIGIKLSSANMIQPTKSLTWIRGMGHNLIHSYRNEFSCQYCLRENCIFRKKSE